MGRIKKKKNKINKSKASILSSCNEENFKERKIMSHSSNNIKNGVKRKKDSSNLQMIEINKSVSTKRVDSLFKKCISYLKESKLELKKVVWPSRKQVIGSTCVVLLVVGLFSLFFGVVDVILSAIHQLILRQ